jgi:hypothetical protein
MWELDGLKIMCHGERGFEKCFIIKSNKVLVGGLRAKILKGDILQNTFLIN